jgi:PAS domain S-box-containing protein
MAKLSNKILLVAALPLCFELTILGILFAVAEKLEIERAEEAHAKEIAWHFNRFNALQIQRCCVMIVRHYTHDSRDAIGKRADEYSDKMMMELNSLETRTDLTATERARLNELRELTVRIGNAYSQATHTAQTASDLEKAMLVAGLENDMRRLAHISESIDDERLQRAHSTKDPFLQYERELKTVIFIAAILSVLSALSLTFWLYKNTSRRLNILVDNTLRIASGNAPQQRLTGEDELARVNKLYVELHRNLQKLREKERALLDNVRDAICAVDSDWRFIEANESIEKLTGYPATEILGRRVADLVITEDQPRLKEALEKALKFSRDSHQQIDLTIRDAAGRQIETEWSMSKSKDQEVTYFVIHDISARKEIERIKQEFRSMVSHDLRTPLTNMRLVLEMVAEAGACGEVAEEARQELLTVLGSLNRVLVLVNNLLDMEKLDFMPGSIAKDNTTVEHLLDEALLSVRALAKQKQISIECSAEKSTVINCDAEKIIQVLVNLLSNAIHYSPSNQRIRLSAVANNGLLKIEIADHGPGIPEDELEKIFDKFYQSKSPSKPVATMTPNAVPHSAAHKTSGLGLAICKQIITLHGGTIGARNSKPNGAIFFFKIPLK